MNQELLKAAYEHFNDYSSWLAQQRMTQHDIRAQLCRLNHFLVFLGTEYDGSTKIFSDRYRRDDAVKQYKHYLKNTLRSHTSSVNAALDTLDRFYQFVGLPPSNVEASEEYVPRALSAQDQWRYLEAARKRAARDRAIVTFLQVLGLTPQYCASLNLDEVKMTTTSGFIVKGGAVKLPISADVRIAILAYLQERADKYSFTQQPALLIDTQGNRMTAAAVDLVVRQIGRQCGLEVTARSLLATHAYNKALEQNQTLLAVELLAGTALM